MSAVMVGIFDSFSDADSVRAALEREGFPASRVELTAGRHKGAAQLPSLKSEQREIRRYFKALFDQDDEGLFVERLAARVVGGNLATVAVHFRGDVETSQATAIFENQGAIQVVQRDPTIKLLTSAVFRGAVHGSTIYCLNIMELRVASVYVHFRELAAARARQLK